MQRRHAVTTLAVAITTVLARDLARAQSVPLRETDPEAVAVDYRADAKTVDPAKSPSYRPGQTCATCSLFAPEGGGSPLGGCQLFLGKDVAAAGWCKAWEARG